MLWIFYRSQNADDLEFDEESKTDITKNEENPDSRLSPVQDDDDAP